MKKDLFQIIEELHKQGKDCALCTVIQSSGSTPLKAGAKMIVSENGEIYGTIGGGDLEKSVIQNAIQIIRQGHSELFTHNLLQQHGMCCGGKLSIFIDFLRKPDKLYIFGAGHVGRALAQIATTLPFDIYLIDDRKIEMDKFLHAGVNKIPLSYKEILPSLPFSKGTYVAIMTRDHAMDREILSYCIHKNLSYLGMIGSRRKIEITKKMFLSGGICTEEEFERIDSPMGISIEAQSPEEIAVSILAGIIQHKNEGPFATLKNVTQINHKQNV